MATTSGYKTGAGTIVATISGLSNPFNQTYYKQVVFTDRYIPSGATSVGASEVVFGVSAPATGSSTSATAVGNYPFFSGTLYGSAQAANGLFYPCGSCQIS